VFSHLKIKYYSGFSTKINPEMTDDYQIYYSIKGNQSCCLISAVWFLGISYF